MIFCLLMCIHCANSPTQFGGLYLPIKSVAVSFLNPAFNPKIHELDNFVVFVDKHKYSRRIGFCLAIKLLRNLSMRLSGLGANSVYTKVLTA